MSVPAAASVYVQVFGSEALWNMHQLNPKHVTTLLHKYTFYLTPVGGRELYCIGVEVSGESFCYF